MPRQNLSLPAFFLLLTISMHALAADPTPAPPGSSVVASVPVSPKSQLNVDLGGYESNMSLSIPLGDRPIPVIKSDDYGTIFRDLMEDSLVPHYLQLTGEVFPVPVLTTYLNTHSPRVWNWARVGTGGINLLESSSAAYLEPWAVSAFLGNIADLQLPGHDQRNDNDMGYAGWMVRAGAQHLEDN